MSAGLIIRYGMVSTHGWWQVDRPDKECWGSPHSAQLFDDPDEALVALEGLGWDAHIVTVIVNVPETPL